MRKVTELKEIQSMALDMLYNINLFCEEKDVRYYLAYGTLLGAVRHKGFIPWDDDIDIWMLRNDFDKFIKFFPAWGDKHGLYLNSIQTVETYNRVHAQVCLKKTRLKAKDRINNYEEGYFVDIFPLDGTPNNRYLRWLRMTELQILKNIVTLASYVPNKKKNNSIIINNIAKIFKNINTRKYMYMYEKLAKKSSCSSSEYLQVLAPGRRKGRNIIMKSDLFSNEIIATFENIHAHIPESYHEILSSIYGDYMKFPPVELRKPHHDFTLEIEE
ncbi:phosphorylcholine transferase LicD [uncultured Phascolarctobacterium sp.]|uniref:LicD family protein n=1 Tax=uncultured Phascolarctobacterium sp. TaxID=512296 RepID=UPI0025D1BA26|nr:LicD family protein [uncultured Phascolarctobacterium sp.]